MHSPFFFLTFRPLRIWKYIVNGTKVNTTKFKPQTGLLKPVTCFIFAVALNSFLLRMKLSKTLYSCPWRPKKKTNFYSLLYIFCASNQTEVFCLEKSGGWTSSPGPEMIFLKCREVEDFLLLLLPGSRDRVRDRKLPSTEQEVGVQLVRLCVLLLLAISTHVTSWILKQCSSTTPFAFLFIGNIVCFLPFWRLLHFFTFDFWFYAFFLSPFHWYFS